MQNFKQSIALCMLSKQLTTIMVQFYQLESRCFWKICLNTLLVKFYSFFSLIPNSNPTKISFHKVFNRKHKFTEFPFQCHHNLTFSKNSSRKLPECQTVWIQVRLDKMLGLIRVQFVCKDYIAEDTSRLRFNWFILDTVINFGDLSKMMSLNCGHYYK